jgi:hypothetical protein
VADVSGPQPDEDLDLLVARADLDGLVRLVDARCDTHDWDGLLRLRDAARAAVRTGRQLWPAATLAEYRTALLAPAPWAARVVVEGTGRFAIGPLTEVVAQHHTWAELAPLLDGGPAAGFVAHERVLRGETIAVGDGAPQVPAVLDLPLTLQPWEPQYPLAAYEPNSARFDTRAPATPVEEVPLPGSVVRVDDPDVDAAVRSLVEPWTTASNGRVEVTAVDGDHLAAIAALGPSRVRTAALSPADALAWLAWAGASGGAHGRRRGAASGRFGAWWTVAAFGAALDDWPLDPHEVGEIATGLRWYWWDAFEPEVGWQLRLAVHDATDGVAWAFAAQDHT